MTAIQLQTEQAALEHLVTTADTIRRVYDERDKYRNALLKIIDRESMTGLTMDQQYERVMEIAKVCLPNS